jgi:hypothetical protein
MLSHDGEKINSTQLITEQKGGVNQNSQM